MNIRQPSDEIDNHIVRLCVNQLVTPSTRQLGNTRGGYESKYISVQQLRAIAEVQPDRLTHDSIDAIIRLLTEAEFADYHQAHFFYRQVARLIVTVIIKATNRPRSNSLLSSIVGLLETPHRNVHRAITESLCTLPQSINGPDVHAVPSKNPPSIYWKEIASSNRLNLSESIIWMGRCLICPLKSAKKDRLLVVKMARKTDSAADLALEVTWQEYLMRFAEGFTMRCQIPVPLMIDRQHVFRLKDKGIFPKVPIDLHPKRYAVAFLADADYFRYPNQIHRQIPLSVNQFKDVMQRNAWLFGRLASMGILHTAPIPLFHNRIQAGRRTDSGRYRWELGGRLDRWLASCAYPNFGVSGIRDFEHFISINDSYSDLPHHMGNHLIGLMLVCGSYFRNKAPYRKGRDASGNPTDTRHLFSPQQLADLLEGIFRQYYEGFTGVVPSHIWPLRPEMLARRMIEEMGVDRHMEEVLRAADQLDMSDAMFQQYLMTQGVSSMTRKDYRQGQQDVVILSGPHLGAFNGPISLPEMIRAVGTMVALCNAGRFACNRLKPVT